MKKMMKKGKVKALGRLRKKTDLGAMRHNIVLPPKRKKKAPGFHPSIVLSHPKTKRLAVVPKKMKYRIGGGRV